LNAKDINENVFTMTTNSTLSKEWVSKNFEKQINEAIKSALGEHFKFDIIVDKNPQNPKKQRRTRVLQCL